MTFTLGDVINAARDRHPLFAKTRIPDAVFARFLTDYQRELLSKAMQRDATVLSTTFSVSSPLPSGNPTGIVLPTYKRVLGGTVHLTSNTDNDPELDYPLTIVDYSLRLRTRAVYSCWITDNTLFQIGTDSDWEDVGSFDVQYVAEPTSFTALTDLFTLPDSARPCLVARSAYMAGNRIQGLPDVPKFDTSNLADDASEAETAWLADVGGQRKSRTSSVREVW